MNPRPTRVLTGAQIREELYKPFKEGKELTRAQMETLFDTALYWNLKHSEAMAALIACQTENINLCKQITDSK